MKERMCEDVFAWSGSWMDCHSCSHSQPGCIPASRPQFLGVWIWVAGLTFYGTSLIIWENPLHIDETRRSRRSGLGLICMPTGYLQLERELWGPSGFAGVIISHSWCGSTNRRSGGNCRGQRCLGFPAFPAAMENLNICGGGGSCRWHEIKS